MTSPCRLLVMRWSAITILICLAIGSCTSPQAVRSQTTGGACDALVGPEPWLILSTETPTGAECVSIGVHQDLQIWNKGTEPLTLQWLGSNIEIESDYHYETGPIGDVLEPGTYVLETSPYQAPDLQVVDPNESPSAQTEVTLEEFGGIKLGMTVAEAAEAFGHPIAVDPNLAPGPECWQAVVVGDPYSPILTVVGEGNADSTITAITVYYPLDAEVTISDPRASPALCP